MNHAAHMSPHAKTREEEVIRRTLLRKSGRVDSAQNKKTPFMQASNFQ